MYQGGMSHVAVYSNALSAAQILNHYYIGTLGSSLPPSIGTQPAGFTNYVGYSRTLSVAAAGTTPLHYQWYKDAALIAGATNNSLVFASLALTNSGSYTVTITNILGSTNSDAAVVSVLNLPTNAYQAAVISQFPQAYYPMNETNGTVCADVINMGNNQATYAYAPTLGVDGASSYLGTAVSLDGATQGIYVNDPNAMPIIGKITLEAWILVQANYIDQTIISHSPAIPQNPGKVSDTMGIRADGNGGGVYYLESHQQVFNTPSYITNGVSYPVPAGDVGTWVHLVGVVDGTVWRLYHNGVEVANVPDTNGVLSANGGWAIGAENAYWSGNVTAPFFWGSINNVGIYDYALTPATVQQHYQLGLTGTNTAPPGVDFDGNPKLGVAPLTVSFTNLTSGATSYVWSFGDGNTNTSANPVNIYTNAGSYTVTLTAVNAGGTSSVARVSYIVASTPPAPPTMSVQHSGANLSVNWSAGYLQEAPAVTGPWSYVNNVVPPYTVGMTNPAMFFRATLQSPP
jgi:hypothetical protein